jgi:hypothetical protein
MQHQNPFVIPLYAGDRSWLSGLENVSPFRHRDATGTAHPHRVSVFYVFLVVMQFGAYNKQLHLSQMGGNYFPCIFGSVDVG